MTTPRQDRTNMRTDPRHIALTIPGEEWRVVPGYSGHFVSNIGRVCSIDRIINGKLCRGRVLRPARHPRSGHDHVALTHDKFFKVHALVLMAFVGPCPPGQEGLHWDDDSANNNLTNLRWGTRSENVYDAIRNGRQPIGEKAPRAKLTDEAVRYIRANPDLTLGALAQKFSVDPNAIWQVRKGITWKHVA